MLAFIKTTFPSLSPATGTAPPSTRSCLRLMVLRRGPPRRRRHAEQSSHRRWRKGDRHFRPQSRDSLPRRASAGKADTRAPHLHINNVNAYHGRLKQWLNRFNGVATKNLPNYLGWRRALEAWGDKLEPPSWIKGAIGNGPYQQIPLYPDLGSYSVCCWSQPSPSWPGLSRLSTPATLQRRCPTWAARSTVL